jgi:hypothetical protein
MRQLARVLIALATLSVLSTCGGNDAGPAAPETPDEATIATLVGRLDLDRFKANILALSQFGDRTQGTQGNRDAMDWIDAQLRGYGYTTVARHGYLYLNQPRENIYATRVGSAPKEMYIASAHMDGRGGGEGADDDASGCALLLELARVLASADVELTRSVRLIFWNNEETGLNGSAAYVRDRAWLQGLENPAGSGVYPEPRWLGVIQHDMILFDHGLPVTSTQSATADLDIEYQLASAQAGPSATLAEVLRSSGAAHATSYPMQVGNNMNNTDSRSFQDFVASVSVRENQRVAEIGNGANPNWHRTTDLYTTYSQADFQFGFNAAKMTLSGLARLAGATLRK